MQNYKEQEQYKLIKEMYNGNQEARRILIEKNIKLVFYIALHKFNSIYDNEDLVSIGTIGLIKAIDNYNISKNIKLSTFACKCIYNEICDHVRKINKEVPQISLDERLQKNNEATFETIINTNTNIEEEIINKELYQNIKDTIRNLQYPSNRIISLYFGFENNIEYSQQEIAKIIGMSQPNVSRLLNKNLKIIKKILISKKLIEIKSLNYNL